MFLTFLIVQSLLPKGVKKFLKSLEHTYFHTKSAKSSKTSFLQKICRRLPLPVQKDNSLKCKRIVSNLSRGGSRAATTSKIECFVTIVNGFQPLIIITKHSILNVAAALDPPLLSLFERNQSYFLSTFQNQRLAKKFVITSICYLGYFFENYLKYFLEHYIFQESKNMFKVNNRNTK